MPPHTTTCVHQHPHASGRLSSDYYLLKYLPVVAVIRLTYRTCIMCVCVCVNTQHMILYTCLILSLGGDDNNSGGGRYESDSKRKKGNSILYLWQRIVFRPQRNLLTKANSLYRIRNLVYSVNALQCHSHDILGGLGGGEIPYTDRIIVIIIIIIIIIIYIVYMRVTYVLKTKKRLTFKCSS